MTRGKITTFTVRGIMITGLCTVLCTAALSVNPGQHADTIAQMDAAQVLSYALVISVLGNVVLVMVFARLLISALSDNTRAFERFNDLTQRGTCPLGRVRE